MGLFYTNLTVYQPRRSALLTGLRHLRREAFVSPTLDGHTVVFDKAMEEQTSSGLIEQFGRAITSELACSALAAHLADGDVLYLWLFQKGRVRDRYNSSPAYFEPDSPHRRPEGGNARLLCKAFDRPEREERVEQLLRADVLEGEMPDVRDEEARHAALVAELGLPPFVAGLGYSPIAGGYVAEEFAGFEFEAV
jgi:hypothetical protein